MGALKLGKSTANRYRLPSNRGQATIEDTGVLFALSCISDLGHQLGIGRLTTAPFNHYALSNSSRQQSAHGDVL
jgi:hypothetical protein